MHPPNTAGRRRQLPVEPPLEEVKTPAAETPVLKEEPKKWRRTKKSKTGSTTNT
jgi:hypothetical protein